MSYDRLSRYLSLILRHHPEVIGISLDAHGWADVDELIAGIAQKKNFNREILEEIVRTDKKQRYSFSEDGTKIRANRQEAEILIQRRRDEDPGKPGAFCSGRSGTSADRTAGSALAWTRGKICRFYRENRAKAGQPHVCASLAGHRDCGCRGEASRQTDSL